MTQVRIDRLQMLADELRRESEVRFEMRSFAERDYCGTAACALGRAAMIPAFAADGLRLEWDLDEGIHAQAVVRFQRCINSAHSAVLFFGLDICQVERLFFSGWDATASQKADQIEALIAEVRGE